MPKTNAEVVKQIAEDMKADAIAFEGRPFDGRTVAEYFGNQGAAIAALARIVGELTEQIQRLEQSIEQAVNRGYRRGLE